MAIWLVRAGSAGEREGYALEKGVAVIGWDMLGDLGSITSKEALLDRIGEAAPETKHRARLNWRSQIWMFMDSIRVGDIIALPLKHRPVIAFGEVTGPYQFDPNAPQGAFHQRPVRWLKEIPRTDIAQDLLYSMGAFMTVCRIVRNEAENRLGAMLAGKQDPVGQLHTSSQEDGDADQTIIDFESLSKEKIRQLLYAQFKGHGLARLVGAVLSAQGYRVTVSPEGADGGVDVLAGTGPLGFGTPRLAVQVKSDQGPIDVKVVRELQGVMKQFGADHGLIVAWGGFKNSVIREMARQFFEIRLWTGDDLVVQVLEHYESLPDEFKAELPLKRIWTVALAEE